MTASAPIYYVMRKSQFIEQFQIIVCTPLYPLPGRGCPEGAGVECGKKSNDYRILSGFFLIFTARHSTPYPPPREGVLGAAVVCNSSLNRNLIINFYFSGAAGQAGGCGNQDT